MLPKPTNPAFACVPLERVGHVCHLTYIPVRHWAKLRMRACVDTVTLPFIAFSRECAKRGENRSRVRVVNIPGERVGGDERGRRHRQATRSGVGRLLHDSELIERTLLGLELLDGIADLPRREARRAEVLVRARRADSKRVEGRLRDAGADHVELRTVRDLVRLDRGDELEVLAEDGSWNELRPRGANTVGAAAHEARHDAEGVGLL